MDEIQLWTALKAGDKGALEKIYRMHIDLLFKYGCRFSKNTQTVEDCIQDLFIELWKNRAGLGSTDSVTRYLLASLRRKVIKLQQKNSRWLITDPQQTYQFDLEIAVDQQLIDREIKAENVQRIEQALEKLSKRQKEAIYLKYYAGMDYEDICQVMDINYQSARNLISAGLKKIKENVGIMSLILLLYNFFRIF